MTKKKTLRQREVEALERQTQILEGQYALTQRMQKQTCQSNIWHTNRLQAYCHKALKLHLSLWTHAMVFHPTQIPIQCFMVGLLAIPTLTMMAQSADYRNVPDTNALEMTREWGQDCCQRGW